MQTQKEEMINFGEILSYYRKKIKLIILVPSIFSIVGIIYSISLPEIFESKGTYEIRSDNKSNSEGILSSLAGGNFSNLIGGSTTSSNKIIQVLRSKENIIKFIFNQDCKKNNSKTGKCIFFEKDNLFPKNLLEYKLTKEDLVQYDKKYLNFSNNIDLSVDDTLITIKYKSVEPSDSYITLVNYINFINLIENYKKKIEVQNSINFAENQLRTGNKTFLKDAYSSALESFTYELSILYMHEDYLLKSLDAPLIPVKKIAPAKTIIVIVFFIGSIGLLLFVLTARFFLKKSLS